MDINKNHICVGANVFDIQPRLQDAGERIDCPFFCGYERVSSLNLALEWPCKPCLILVHSLMIDTD